MLSIAGLRKICPGLMSINLGVDRSELQVHLTISFAGMESSLELRLRPQEITLGHSNDWHLDESKIVEVLQRSFEEISSIVSIQSNKRS